MKMTLTYLTTTTTIIIAIMAMGATSSPYILDFMRSQSLNSINFLTLGCADVDTGAHISNAIFFLEDDIFFDLNRPGTFSEDRPVANVEEVSGNRILFVIHPLAEGRYSCGRRLDSENFIKSPKISLVALPSVRITPLFRIIINARVGSKAILGCPQQLGLLTQQYYGEWTNSTSNLIFANTPKPSRRRDPFSVSPRYSILAANFSLMIDDVGLSDSGFLYQCELKVEDPQNVVPEFSYRPVVVELVVFEPPEIISPPRSTVVSMETSTASFSCAALGPVAPELSWTHAGKLITTTIADGTKYNVTSTLFSSNGRLGRRGLLVVSDLNVGDTGLIGCIATVPPGRDTSDSQLLTDVASAPFSILGPYENLMVFITTKHDVIYSLTFPVAPLHPVRLRLLYHEVGGAEMSQNITSGEEYVNSSEISFVASGSFVPFDRFQVEIRLVCGDGGEVLGTGKTDRQVHDRTKPSDISMIIRDVVLPCVLPFLLVLAIIVTTLITLCFYSNNQRQSNKRRIIEGKASNISKAIDMIREQLKEAKGSEMKKFLNKTLLDALAWNNCIDQPQQQQQQQQLQQQHSQELEMGMELPPYESIDFTDGGGDGPIPFSDFGPVSRSDSGISGEDDGLTDEMAESFASITKAMLHYGYSNTLLKKHVHPVVMSCDGNSDCDES